MSTLRATPETTIGVDTGGTFTDFVWLGSDNSWHVHKQLSTPQDPSAAILTGLGVVEATPSRSTIIAVVHGSTVATNALLERRGARTALISTAGFEDVLAIGRQNRPDLYALVPRKPAPLAPKRRRFGVPERVSATGEVLIPLTDEALAPLKDQLAEEQVEAVAVALLFSFLRPEHEQLIRSTIMDWQEKGELPAELHVSLSSEILPEYREYERTATTVVNAYVAPLMSRYLTRLAKRLAPKRVMVMQSNGGVISAQTAAKQAARTVLSGPAGGVVGARFIAGQSGYSQIITFDMGGTSTDVALCPGRLPATTRGEIAGLPLRLPIVDIHTVGAGGGSLAFVDAGGALHVGPQSAGANPGPACYGLSSDEPRATTTDANLLLGRLSAEHFLGGSMRLDEALARQALTVTAAAMGVSTPEEAAWDVIQVANATMERAIRRISVERGYDPRQFTLVAFGGAGPLHACELAARLQIPRVLAPPAPGVLSALGMLVAAPTKDYSQTVMLRLDDHEHEASPSHSPADIETVLAAQFQPLQNRALAEMADEGYQPAEVALRRLLDMRYVGQSHELQIHAPEGGRGNGRGNGRGSGREIGRRFHAAHENRYGYQHEGAGMEIVTLRLQATVQISTPSAPALPSAPPGSVPANLGEKRVWFDGQPLSATLYDRQQLQPGHSLVGPAVLFQYDTTIVVPPGWPVVVDKHGCLLIGNSIAKNG